MRRALAGVAAGVLLLTACTPPTPDTSGSRYREPVEGDAGVVATESPVAGRVGLAVLEGGGNAVDAGVAAVLALGVARPQSCGLGGGGFLVYQGADGVRSTLDFRETAPAAFAADTLSGPGRHRSRTGHRTVGVPGTVAGLAAALERHGTLRLAEVVAPAEQLARGGVTVTPALARTLREHSGRLRLYEASAAVFLTDGHPPEVGDRLVQEDLAGTLALIAEQGPSAFYTGAVATAIEQEMRRAPETDGLLTGADLAAYAPVWREPLVGAYRGHEVVTIGPPSSGGVAVLQMLNLLGGFDLRRAGFGTADHLHLLAEAQKIAFADRARWLADPDAVDVPVAELVDPAYADDRRTEIDPGAAAGYDAGEHEVGGTSHVSVIDADGNAVAITCTIETGFGSAVVVPGTGVLLNNQLTDFTGPGTANEPGPGKRPRSSMTPAIVSRDGVPVLVVGGAGGERIIMGTLQAVVNVVDFRMTVAAAVDAPRLEAGRGSLVLEGERFAPEVIDELRARGHAVTATGEYRNLPRVLAAGVDRQTGSRSAVSDPRTEPGAFAEAADGR